MNAQIPWHSSAHVIHKIESRDQYVLRGATVDTWLAASVLLELFPDTTENLNYTGCSFGGGMGALALPWDHRFKHAYLDIPTFGHHHLRLKYESLGSGESVRKFYDTHPDIIETLRYYDAALSAKYIKIPVVCTPALFDPVVVPPGQFAIANALNSQSETIILPTGHFDSPESTEIKEKLDPRLEKMFEA
jgi:cephalosporin-C deacetylase